MPITFIGTDVGGTFTDFVLLHQGEIQVFKLPTTPADQSKALVDGLVALGILSHEGAALTEAEIVHGTTAATNALLERRGARTALVTTAGFADVIEIGRQNRPHLYRLQQERPPQLVPMELRYEVAERIDVDGDPLLVLENDECERLATVLAAATPQSVAIALLFAYRNGDHERALAAAIRQHAPDLPISLSSEILPEYREYERTATTVVNAYVQPLIANYMERLTARVGNLPVRVMQSNGGAIGTAQATREAARLVLSGPAGGVVGAFGLAQRAMDGAEPHIITFDMGGTSTDVALCPGVIPRSTESEIAGLPLRLPAIDIHTVGAGGGSLASVDPAGGLRVGPQSAGAVPGPVCYGRGGIQPTVTDANLVLGRLAADQFLGGQGDLSLDTAAATAALGRLGTELGGYAPQQAALGLIRVANATMERALRRVSVERGFDPRHFTLVPFGGAGPLHACDLADALAVRRILLPPSPGVLSALGLLLADLIHEGAQAVLTPLSTAVADPTGLQSRFEALATQTAAILRDEGVETPTLQTFLDLRYPGQSYELTVPCPTPIAPAALIQAAHSFHAEHARRYGYRMENEELEIVTLRVRGHGPGAEPPLHYTQPGAPDPSSAEIGVRAVWFQAEGPTSTMGYDRRLLRPGHRFAGPAMVYQLDTTTVVGPGWSATVDGWRNLWLERDDS